MDFLVHDSLIKGIIEGRYQPGDRLPSDNDLAAEFGVPRLAVRDVYHRLEEMGYIVSRKGKGRFLRNNRRILNLNLSGAESFTDKMHASGVPLITRVIRNEPDSNGKAALFLGSRSGDKLWRTDRIRLVDGVPVALHISWVRQDFFPDLPERGWETESLFAYFRSKGYSHFKSTSSTLDVTFPTSDEQQIFGCPSLVPLLVLVSDTIDAKSLRPLQLTRILYRSDCFKYSF